MLTNRIFFKGKGHEKEAFAIQYDVSELIVREVYAGLLG